MLKFSSKGFKLDNNENFIVDNRLKVKLFYRLKMHFANL